jgi:hypothetical protein
MSDVIPQLVLKVGFKFLHQNIHANAFNFESVGER